MKTKIMLIITFIILSLISFSAYAEDFITVTRDQDKLTVTGEFESLNTFEDLSIIVINEGSDIETINSKSGDITSEIAYIGQIALDASKSFVIDDIPFEQNFKYGKCKFYIGADSLNTCYLYEIDILKLTINKTGDGTVNETGEKKMLFGETFTLFASPLEGNRIDYIKFNGITVINDFSEEKYYTTPALNKDSTLDVVFGIVHIMPPEEITMPAFAYTSAPFEEHTGIDGKTTDSPFGISFARAESKYGSYIREEYGMLFSKTLLLKEEFNLTNINVVKYKGEVAPNALGQYGIKLYGPGIKSNETYYLRAYAIYENNGSKTIVYGDRINEIKFN